MSNFVTVVMFCLSSSAAGQSTKSGSSSLGSASYNQSKNILIDSDRNEETEEQHLLSSLPYSSFDGGDLSSGSTGGADPEKTLALNRALQGILEGHIEAIQEALEQNKDLQERLEDDSIKPKKPNEPRTGRFRAPYFRIGSEVSCIFMV
ncbi:hypothetical protein ElyMa_004954700 [Elysia marginata]|uniref:Corticotropin-releasing factor domain-containing protein n=1 Tax=Elysia marginata TaxID=1093978 RepID=A0AAV4J3W9_9GAST|nr:hypothetical protein ElyMa_004954700 [Elysia marginata]